MQWGLSPVGAQQEYYKGGRTIEEIKLNDIDGVCKCGYITLLPKTEFERHNGGMRVKRSKVKIFRSDGSKVFRLRKTKDSKINHYYQCDACVNDWK